MRTLDELGEWLDKMMEDGKVGMTESSFEDLNENDKIAYAVSTFTYQVFNGGLTQLIANEYKFLFDYLKQMVVEKFDMKRLQYYITQAEYHYNQFENGELREVDYEILMDDLDTGIYNQGLLSELREKASDYLKNQQYE